MTGPARLRWPLGVVDIAYANMATVSERARAAAGDGFEHIDALYEFRGESLAIPMGCPTAFPKPIPAWCSTPAPPRAPDPTAAWERVRRWWNAAPEALLEPWAGAVIATIDEVRELRSEIPQLRLCVDTGHIADMGADVFAYLPYAGHVQLRQGCEGNTQLHVDDTRGTVDFAAVLQWLEANDYAGKLSVEHFDLPEIGWPLDSPRQWACDLAATLR